MTSCGHLLWTEYSVFRMQMMYTCNRSIFWDKNGILITVFNSAQFSKLFKHTKYIIKYKDWKSGVISSVVTSSYFRKTVFVVKESCAQQPHLKITIEGLALKLSDLRPGLIFTFMCIRDSAMYVESHYPQEYL